MPGCESFSVSRTGGLFSRHGALAFLGLIDGFFSQQLWAPWPILLQCEHGGRPPVAAKASAAAARPPGALNAESAG